MKKMKWRRVKEVIRKGKKKWIITICLLCVVVVGVGSVISRKSRAKGTEPGMEISTTVQKGTIQTSVSGTGTISYADSSEIVIPENLTMDEVKVSEGSSVTEGTLLATVDEASLTSCLSEVQEAISEVDDTIASEKSSTTSKSVTAGVAGRVKKIYAEEDARVADVMTQSGAMMLISADGYMCVTVSGTANVSVGDTVTVCAQDTETDGTVEEITDAGTIVTFDDSVFDYETEVTVINESDVTLGTGTAEIHEPMSVVATAGTIASVNVSENDSVSASTKVITLDGASHTAEYIQAVKERESLVELLNTLIDIQQNGGIVAKADGVITAINTDSVSATTTDSDSKSVVTLGEISTTESKDYAQLEAVVDDNSEIAQLTESDTDTLGFETMSITSLGTADTLQAINETSSDHSSTEGTTETGNTATENLSELPKQETENSTEAATEQTVNGADAADSKEQNTETSKKTTTQKQGGKTEEKEASKGEATVGSMSSSAGNGSTEYSSTETANTSTEVATMTAFTIADGEQMTVTMYVDELDVLSIQEGLQAEITLDAIEDSTFEGTISGVGAQANSSGGVAQYPIVITFDKTEDMLSGMNASVKVILEEADDVLTIPLTAVTEEGDTSYVYTGYDESSRELTGKTAVTLGVSDENTVEVTDGLSEGDTIYYQMVGGSSDESGNTSKKGQMPDNMGGGMPSDMPGGGNGEAPSAMPGGGSNGGGRSQGNGGRS